MAALHKLLYLQKPYTTRYTIDSPTQTAIFTAALHKLLYWQQPYTNCFIKSSRTQTALLTAVVHKLLHSQQPNTTATLYIHSSPTQTAIITKALHKLLYSQQPYSNLRPSILMAALHKLRYLRLPHIVCYTYVHFADRLTHGTLSLFAQAWEWFLQHCIRSCHCWRHWRSACKLDGFRTLSPQRWRRWVNLGKLGATNEISSRTTLMHIPRVTITASLRYIVL